MPFPTLKSDNLLLRQIIADDIEKVFEGLSHPDVIKYYGVSFHTLAETKTQMDWYAQMMAEDTGRCWAICAADNSVFYGVITLPFWDKVHRRAELGYWLLPNFWKQGIATKAAKLVIDYAFNQLHIHRIKAEVEDDNAGSIATLQKLGFQYEGTQRECEIKNGKFINLQIFALLQHTTNPKEE